MSVAVTAPEPEVATELVALRVLSTAIRCREVGGGLVTYRKSSPEVVPGERLTVRAERRWTFRRTAMIGGDLLHAGLSLRALLRAGYELPASLPDGDLRCPGHADGRLREGLLELEAGQWVASRALLLDVLEDAPGCLVAHAHIGGIHAALHHARTAMGHYTAAIRLGMGALVPETSLPLDVTREAPAALLLALVGRATLLVEAGRPAEAAADLRRVIAWDPADALGAVARLAELGADGAP